MRKMYEIDFEIEGILEKARIYAQECDGEVPQELWGELEALQIEREEKIEAVILYRKEQALYQKQVKDEMKRLKDISDRTDKQLESLDWYIKGSLKGEKFKTAQCQVSYRQSTKTIVDDLENIDPKFIIVTETKKAALKPIKEAILNGEEVKGARLETNINMTIK